MSLDKLLIFHSTLHFGVQNPAAQQEVAMGESIIYTYDVAWKESDTHWASRWDIYLTMNHAVKNRVRALSRAGVWPLVGWLATRRVESTPIYVLTPFRGKVF